MTLYASGKCFYTNGTQNMLEERSFMTSVISLVAWIFSVGKISHCKIISHSFLWISFDTGIFDKLFDFNGCFSIWLWYLNFFIGHYNVLCFWIILIMTGSLVDLILRFFMNFSTNSSILITVVKLLLFVSNK